MANPTRVPIVPSHLTEKVMNRFWEKVRKADTCWTWTGARSHSGYGQFYLAGKQLKAHRVALVYATQEDLSPGFDTDHLCKNRSCVNPDHLEAVTPRENLKRSAAYSSPTIKAYDKRRECKNGHDMTLPNAWAPVEGGRWRRCRRCDLEGRAERRRATRAKLRAKVL